MSSALATPNPEKRPLLDEHSLTNLDDHGLVLGIAYSHDGTAQYWLLQPDDNGDPGCACRNCAPHEQLTGDGS